MKTNDIKTETTTEKELMIDLEVQNTSYSEIQNTKYFVTHDEIVGYDHCGWPLYQLRVISLLRAMGMSDDIIDQIPEDILTSTITTLEDDGMGYGVNEECIVNCAIDKKNNIVYLWRIPNIRKEDKNE